MRDEKVENGPPLRDHYQRGTIISDVNDKCAKKHRLAVAGQPVHHKETHTSCVAMNNMHLSISRLVVIFTLGKKIMSSQRLDNRQPVLPHQENWLTTGLGKVVVIF